MLPDEGLIGRVVMSRRSLTVPDVQAVGSGFARHEIALAEGLHGFAAAPMVAHGQVVGAVAVFSRTKETLPDDRLEFLEMLAGQAAIGISHADSFLELQRSNEQLLLAYDASIAGWSRALDLRDHETQGHSRRVTDITVALARRAGIEGIDLRYIRWGALLHDIGKMGVPDQILRKPSPLTPEEWDIVRQHPVIARDLLRPIKYLEPALAIPHAHHERWDGSGYPDGLSGEAIPFAARLFAVVDVFDAMRSSRPYRVGLEESMVLEHLRTQAGIQLDPELVELFCTAMPEIPECRDPAYDSG
jgi:putative nucleotidyltransferase with HDIG domain